MRWSKIQNNGLVVLANSSQVQANGLTLTSLTGKTPSLDTLKALLVSAFFVTNCEIVF
jgi:hypothetical protein